MHTLKYHFLSMTFWFSWVSRPWKFILTHSGSKQNFLQLCNHIFQCLGYQKDRAHILILFWRWKSNFVLNHRRYSEAQASNTIGQKWFEFLDEKMHVQYRKKVLKWKKTAWAWVHNQKPTEVCEMQCQQGEK